MSSAKKTEGKASAQKDHIKLTFQWVERCTVYELSSALYDEKNKGTGFYEGPGDLWHGREALIAYLCKEVKGRYQPDDGKKRKDYSIAIFDMHLETPEHWIGPAECYDVICRKE